MSRDSTPLADVLLAQTLLPAQVRTHRTDQGRISNPLLEEWIEQRWQEQQAAAERTQREFFNGPLFRLNRFVGKENQLDLEIGLTNYKEFLGTNLFPPPFRSQLSPDHLANPLGTSALIVTADHQIVLGLRSDRVAFHPNTLHTFGGILESADEHKDGSIDVFSSIRRELKEELSLNMEQLISLTLQGLVRDPLMMQPELVFRAETRQEYTAVLAAWESAEDRHEHQRLVPIANDAGHVRRWLQSCGPIAPVAQAGLLLCANPTE